jgi:hypothetical protein
MFPVVLSLGSRKVSRHPSYDIGCRNDGDYVLFGMGKSWRRELENQACNTDAIKSYSCENPI